MPAGATKYSKAWESLPECQGWLSLSVLKDGTEKANCSWCNSHFTFKHGGLKDVKSHANTKKHQQYAQAKVGTKSVTTFIGKLIVCLNFIINCNMQMCFSR